MSQCGFPEHHDSGGSGIGMAVVAVLVGIVAAAAMSPLIAALTVLIHVLVIAVPAALAAFAVLAGWRVKRGRAMLPLPSRRRRILAPRQQRPELEQQPGGTHLHFHGISAEQVAAIIARQRGE